MSVYAATIINAIVLIGISSWSYFATQGSLTPLIPAIVGMVLLCLAPRVRFSRPRNTYGVMFLTALILVALCRPLLTTVQSGNPLGSLRTGLMMVSSLVTLAYYCQCALAKP